MNRKEFDESDFITRRRFLAGMLAATAAAVLPDGAAYDDRTQTVFYVDGEPKGDRSGSSWANAMDMVDYVRRESRRGDEVFISNVHMHPGDLPIQRGRLILSGCRLDAGLVPTIQMG